MAQPTMDALWDAVTNVVAGLALTVPANPDTDPASSNGTIIPVVKRKLVRSERVGSLDGVCQITVFRPEQPEKTEYYSFTSRAYTWNFIIAIVYPGNQNNTSNIGVYAGHRQKIKQAFEVLNDYPALNVPGAFDMRINPDVWLPRAMFALNYDYQAIGVSIKATS